MVCLTFQSGTDLLFVRVSYHHECITLSSYWDIVQKKKWTVTNVIQPQVAYFYLPYLTCQVLKNGVEVKLQRNALSVLEHPTGHEENDDHYYDISSSSSDIGEKDNDFCKLVLNDDPWSCSL